MAEESLPTVKAYCPNCDGPRTCVVHGMVTKLWEVRSEPSVDLLKGRGDSSLLECRGCEFVFYQDEHWSDTDFTVRRNPDGEEAKQFSKTVRTFPKLGRRNLKPTWVDTLPGVDSALHNILDQMYMAHENRALILTAIALRTALDRATEVLGIDGALSFDEKLDRLLRGGWIGDTERGVLGVVTDAGSAAAHRGWEPTHDEVQLLVAALEAFLQRAFGVGQHALKIRDRIPARPRRERHQKAEARRLPPPAKVAAD